MRRIFGITLLLILYGSLYPFQFHVRALPGNPLWLLLHSWPASVDRFLLKDAALNVLIYIPIGVFGSLSIGNHRPRRRAAVLVLSLALVLSTSIEMLQLFDDTRTSSCLDIVMNVTGSAFGVWLACSYRTAMVRFWNRVDVRALFRPSAALLLLCCWIGYQTFPMIPDLSHTRLLLKLAVLGHVSSLSAVRTIGSVIDWLMAAHLLQTVAGSVRTRRLLPLLMLLLPARLLILARNVTWPELIGAACDFMLWLVLF